MTQIAATTEATISGEDSAMAAAHRNPEAAQAITMFAFARRGELTGFGRQNNFHRIDSVERFRDMVPQGNLHTHRSMIELQRATGAEILTSDEIVAFLNVATGKGRYQTIPYTSSDQTARQKLAAQAYQAADQIIGLFDRGVVDFTQLSGTPYIPGVDSAGVDPIDLNIISGVADKDARYYLGLLLLAADCDVTGLVAMSAEQLVALDDIVRRDAGALLADLEARTVRVHDRIGATLSRAVRERLTTDPVRLEELQSVMEQNGGLRLSDLLPGLKAAAIVGLAGDAEIAAGVLPTDVRLLDLGCWLAEGMLTVPAMDGSGDCVPTLLDNFFEFEAEGEDRTVGLHQLESGRTYAVQITTASGLYRCRLDIRACVTGWVGNCPKLCLVSNSKVGNSQDRAAIGSSEALSAVQSVMQALEAPRPFVRLCSRRDGGFRVVANAVTLHCISAASLADAFDTRFRAASYRYHRLRELGQIGPVEITVSAASRPGTSATGGVANCSAA